MKKINIIIILSISLILLVSCTTGGKNTKTSASGFIGGTEGISSSISIVSTSGDNKVYDSGNDPFKIQIKLENKGEHEVKENEVLVTLDAINFIAYQIKDVTQPSPLILQGLRKEGTKTTSPTQAVVLFDANYKPVIDADTSATIAANICYKYQTLSVVKDLCVRKKITGPSTSTTCKVEETKQPENSGAPFRVKIFNERPSGENKVNIYFEAENERKTGTIYTKDYLSKGKCLDVEADKNKVYIKVEFNKDDLTAAQNSASIISCNGLSNKNEGFVNVIQNKIQLSCNIDTSGFQEQTSKIPLRITTDYVYKDSVSTTVTIKKSV